MTNIDTRDKRRSLSGVERIRPRSAIQGIEPAVTVVIPCYNYGRYLPQAVGSVLSQSGISAQVIIVDDDSVDGSLDVARRLACDARVTVLANSENLGMVETFNRGLAAAEGEFIVRLDADDLLTPGSLERAIAVFQSFPEVGLVYGHPVHFSGTRLPRARTRPVGWTIWSGPRWLELRCESPRNVITSPEVVMRASTVHRAGPQLALRHTPDMEMWLRMAAFGEIAFIRGADQAWHREHEFSMSATEVNDALDISERIEMFEALLAGPVGQLANASRLDASWRKGLAEEALLRACREYDRGRGASEEKDHYVRVATSLCDDIETLRGWRPLLHRERRGIQRSARLRHAALPRFRRRILAEVSSVKWRREGVL